MLSIGSNRNQPKQVDSNNKLTSWVLHEVQRWDRLHGWLVEQLVSSRKQLLSLSLLHNHRICINPWLVSPPGCRTAASYTKACLLLCLHPAEERNCLSLNHQKEVFILSLWGQLPLPPNNGRARSLKQSLASYPGPISGAQGISSKLIAAIQCEGGSECWSIKHSLHYKIFVQKPLHFHWWYLIVHSFWSLLKDKRNYGVSSS